MEVIFNEKTWIEYLLINIWCFDEEINNMFSIFSMYFVYYAIKENVFHYLNN